MMCLRESPWLLGSGPMRWNTFVPIMTLALDAKSLRARPNTSSLLPSEYISAVSKKLIPSSIARLMNGRPCSSFNTHGLHSGEPYVIAPRQSRETFKPVVPSLMYSMSVLSQLSPELQFRIQIPDSFSMRFQPIIPDPDFHFDGHRKGKGLLHLSQNYFPCPLLFALRDLEDKFVVHLEQHRRIDFFFPKDVVDFYHRDLDHVCGRSLNRHVDRLSLGVAADVEVPAVDVREVSPPADEGGHIAILPCLLQRVEDVLVDLRKPFEVPRDEGLCFRLGDSQPGRKPEGPDAVHDAVVDFLRFPAQLFVHVLERDAEYPDGGRGVDVFTAQERLAQSFVSRDVRHDPQLDLRVICRHEAQVRISGDECLADTPPDFGPDRDVLKIWIAAREPSCGGNRLIERCMDAARAGVHQQGQQHTSELQS